MIKIEYKIDNQNHQTDETYSLLKTIFRSDLLQDGHINYFDEMEKWVDSYYFKEVRNSDIEKLLVTANYSISFPYHNFSAHVMYRYTLPDFFNYFPDGVVFVLNSNSEYFYESWKQEIKYAETICGFTEKHTAIEYSGLKEENLLFNLIDLFSYTLYPYYCYELINISINHQLIFLPKTPIQYEQISNRNPLYKHIIFKKHYCYDDQWTFDSVRGPKSNYLNKEEIALNIDKLLELHINSSSRILDNLYSLKDIKKRNQLIFTLNSIILDHFYVSTSQIPYLTKTFLFQMMDKSANILKEIRFNDKSETAIWKHLFSKEFLTIELKEFINQYFNDYYKQYFGWIPEMVSEELKMNNITDDLLRSIRNSSHGFLFNEKKMRLLNGSNLEINNDISYYSTVILIYILISIELEYG